MNTQLVGAIVINTISLIILFSINRKRVISTVRTYREQIRDTRGRFTNKPTMWVTDLKGQIV